MLECLLHKGGSGFPFLAEAVFEFLSMGKCTGAEVDVDSVPDPALVVLLSEVITLCNLNIL